MGNRTVQTRTITTTLVTTYTYDAANRLATQNGQSSFTWDANGNMLADGSTVYAYDFANRLISTTLSGVNTQVGYNGDGIRLRLIEAGTLTTYTQDYAAPLPVVLQAKTGTGSTQYVYSLGTRPLAEYEAAAWEYLLPDPLGSVRQIADPSGNVTLLKSYEPYGSVLSSQGSAASVFAYAGEQMDAYIKLVFLRARYYSPETARFLTKDVWQGDYTTPQSFNGWSYVEGNPINFADPSGFIKESEAAEADAWRDNLRFLYGIEIARDYGYGYLYTLANQVWIEGAWRSVDELKLISKAVNYISPGVMDVHKFKSAMQGPVRITRWPGTTFLSFVPPGLAAPVLGDMVLTDHAFNSTEEFNTYVIIHEFGHVWDVRTGNRLSQGMAAALGTIVCEEIPIGEAGIGAATACVCQFDINAQQERPPGDRDDPYAGESLMEDWAEAFATYVYPIYYAQNARNRPLGILRTQYVEEQIRSIP